MSEVWSALEGGVVGVAVGTAAATAVEPALEPERQDAWKKSKAKILELDQLAELVAQRLLSVADVEDDAARNGYAKDQLLSAVQMILQAPPYNEALELWRRGKIDQPLVEHALSKAKIERQYWPALLELFDARLQPSVIALAIVRGIMENPTNPSTGEKLLPVGPPTEAGKVPSFPVSPLKPLLEAIAAGIDFDRLFVETAIAGRPMSLHEAASAYFRGIIERQDFDRAVSEGDTRNEWRDPILEQAREILTAGEYVESHLRGWTDEATMLANTAKHGMSPEDTQRLFELHGRPIPVHQVTTGLARGGTYNGDASQIPEAYIRSLQQGNERPEWYSLSYANRYSYPSAFVLRALTQNGEITEADAEQILLFEGWEPTLAAKVAKSWAGGTGQSVASEVKSARTKLLTKLHTLYVSGQATDAQAISALQAEAYDPAIIDGLLQVWGTEKALIQAVGSNQPGPIT